MTNLEINLSNNKYDSSFTTIYKNLKNKIKNHKEKCNCFYCCKLILFNKKI